MEDSRPVVADVCGVDGCRSRKYEQWEDGFFYCQNGHRRGNMLAVGQDQDDYKTGGKRNRIQKPKEDEKVYQYYRGREAYDLYLKSLQLILRHQIKALTTWLGLPKEIETITIDFWTLRILKLESRAADLNAPDDGAASQQMFTSQSEPETDVESAYTQTTPKRLTQPRRRLESTPNLLDCLALLYLSAHTLHLPLTAGDIHSAILSGQLPYFRAIKLLPRNMINRFPANYHAVLDPNGILTKERLNSSIMDLASCLSKEFGMSFPARNYPLLMWRYLKEVRVPLDVYPGTRKLSEMLHVGFVFPTPEDTSGAVGSKKRSSVRDIPDAQIASLVIICVKLLYPFDSTAYKRYPTSADEPAALRFNWETWTSLLTNPPSAPDSPLPVSQVGATTTKKPASEAFLTLTEKDVFDMDSTDIDNYLDWYQDTWIDERVGERSKNKVFLEALWEMFPLSNTPSASAPGPTSTSADNATSADQYTDPDPDLQAIKDIHAAMKPVRVQDENDQLPRPGMGYKQYRRPTDLSGPAKLFYERVAGIAGVSVEMLVRSVFLWERRIMEWQKKEERGRGGR